MIPVRCWRQIVLYTCVVVLLTVLSRVAAAQDAPGSAASPTDNGYAISLDQYNRYGKWRLRGVDGRGGLVFGVRQDERIRDLRLDLTYRHSPALLDDLSHLNVLLNGEVVESIPLVGDDSASAKEVQVVLPIDGLQDYNYLQLQAISHYTMECEDPLHSSLWVDIDPRSRLLFSVVPQILPDELGLLPLPFFDERDVRPVELAFLLDRPTNARLEAAGILASWLGSLASYRGTHFTAVTDGLPQSGNAVVILGADQNIPGLSLPAAQGPTVAMRPNPNDPGGKLLIVQGRNDEEIRQAATALVLGAPTLSGDRAVVQPPLVQPRLPYDAPNWLPTHRPVALGELLPEGELTAAGFEPQPITVGLRLPPDLSDWRVKTIPLDLRYRHSAAHQSDGTLEVMVNQQRVRRFDLGAQDETVRRLVQRDDSLVRRTVPVPLSLLGSQAGLQFQFLYPPPAQSECRGALIDTHRSAIDPSSTIDLSGLPHHIAMPDLAAFGTAGFPFTRMADLSETVVVLTPHATQYELSAFLNLMGRMGQSTGYPATGVTVVQENEVPLDKDALLIESGERSELLNRWAHYMPAPRQRAALTSDRDSFAGWIASFSDWVSRNTRRSGTGVSFTAPAQGAYLAGFESPESKRRSVVVVAGADGPSLLNAVHLLSFDEQQRSRLQGGLAVVQDGRIQSLSDAKTYSIGNLGPFQALAWFLSLNPFLLYVLYLFASIVVAVVLYLSLRARAQMRLHTNEPDSTKSNELN